MPRQIYRYKITIMNGSKRVEEHMHNDYDKAMNLLDTLTENLPPTYSIEFKDTIPFMSKYKLTTY